MNVSSLHVAGFALALGAASFAGLMILGGAERPGVAGIVPPGAGTPWKRTIETAASPGVDRTPVGSLPDAQERAALAGASAPVSVPRYVVRSALEGMALVEGPDGLQAVRRGSILPGLGRVTAIEQRDGEWRLVTAPR